MDTHDIVALLTPMERRVAERVIIGTQNKEIGREFGLSDGTVKVHLRAILKKARCRNRTELAYKLHSIAAEAALDRCYVEALALELSGPLVGPPETIITDDKVIITDDKVVYLRPIEVA